MISVLRQRDRRTHETVLEHRPVESRFPAPTRSLGTDLHVAFWERLLERYLGHARTALGPDAEAARTRGLELPFDDAVALALQEAPPRSSARTDADQTD